MFEEKRFGLETLVLRGMKDMTRRLVKLPEGIEPDDVEKAEKHIDKKGRVYFTLTVKGKTFEECNIYPKYQVGEEVAVAQAYKDIIARIASTTTPHSHDWMRDKNGWNNKMFVLADLMPRRIRIKSVKMERLQDISDEDCRKEGIIPIQWKQWLKQDINDFSPQKCRLHNLWTLPKFEEGLLDSWADREPDSFMAESPQIAFYVIIIKTMSKKVWQQNPWVFAYTFELLG